MNTNPNIVHTKAGIVTTDANGIAWVVFRPALQYGFSYSVLLTCEDPGQAVLAFPGSMSQTGFKITSMDTNLGGGAYGPVASVTVHWVALIRWNA